MGGEVAVIAGAVTEIVKAGGQISARVNARNDRQDAALDAELDTLRKPVPAPAPLPDAQAGHRWLAGSPTGTVLYVAEADSVDILAHDDLRDGFRARLLEGIDKAIAAGMKGPIGIAIAIYPAEKKA